MTTEKEHCLAVARYLVATDGPCRLHPAMDYEVARAEVAAVIERQRQEARESLIEAIWSAVNALDAGCHPAKAIGILRAAIGKDERE